VRTILAQILLCGLLTCIVAVADPAEGKRQSVGASLQIHAVGLADVQLKDPKGRVYPRTDSLQSLIPDCSSSESVFAADVS
jgi:hypothetical protein